MTLTPLNGFTKKVADLPDRPNASMTSTEVKAQFDAAVEELRVFLNGKLLQIDTDFALKSEIASALLGQILDGSLTDVKLSNTTGQIKERLSSFIATKGQPNGFTPLDANGVVPDGYIKKGMANGVPSLGSDAKIPSSFLNPVYAVGSYTGDNTNPRFISVGKTPAAVIITGDNTGGGILGVILDTVYGGAIFQSASNKSTNMKIISNGFYVGVSDFNATGVNYKYIAI